jgi:hypothetical protein
MPRAWLRSVRADWRKAGLMQLDSIVRQEIEQAMDRQVKPSLVRSHEKIVEDWKHKPGFAARKYLEPSRIRVAVYPTGEHKMIWYYVDRGTRPHTIPAVTGKLMVFRAGGTYVPKTMARPARTVVGGGYVEGGQKVFTTKRKAFIHPGSEGRDLSGQIARDLKPDFQAWINNAFRRAARRINKQ